MGKLQNFICGIHAATERDYLGRMLDRKPECMEVARRFDREYWDGDRRYGYGGYRYDGRWKAVAERLIDVYELKSGSKVLDVGCGKAHLLYELSKILPSLECVGFDISEYALQNAPEEFKGQLLKFPAECTYPFEDKAFDLVLSLATLHNLKTFDLAKALQEIQRVGKQGYVMLDSYRNPAELFNLQCWTLTLETAFDPNEWRWFFDIVGYSGDYEFIYFP